MTRTSLFFATAAFLSLAMLLPSKPRRCATAPLPPPTANLPAATATLEGLTLSAKLGQRAVARSTASRIFASVELTAAPAQARRPRGRVSLALLVDRSGSMAGQKLSDARRAAVGLINALEDGDRLAIISYGSDVTGFPSLEVNAETREILFAQANGIGESGGTNLSEALRAGAEALKGQEGYVARRIILISDGHPNEGLTQPAELLGLAADLRETHGVAVSALGVGTDFNDQLMRELANHGGGFYAFLPYATGLASILRQELAQAIHAVGRQIEVRLQPSPGVTVQDVSGFPWRREADGTVVVEVYDLAAGKSARILTELTVAPGTTQPLVLTALSFTSTRSGERVSAARLLTAERTDDAEALADGRDVQVHADSLRVLGGRQIAEATREFERGNKARARGLFSNVRTLFGASAEALSGDLAALNEAERKLLAAPAHAVTSQSMNIRKSLTHFGANNAY